MHWTQETLNRKSSLSQPMKLIQQYEPHFSCCITHIELTAGWRSLRSFVRRLLSDRALIRASRRSSRRPPTS